MRLRTRLRASSALWAFPVAIGLALFYYYEVTATSISASSYAYAPTLVAYPLASMYPFAYALASALGAWESGRLTRGAVWQLAPARSRYRIAAEALGPVLALAWLMLLLPVVIAFVQESATPTLASLRPLLMALLVCVAHSVIGFAVGLRIKPVFAAPVLAVVVFLLVATSVALEPFWWRHVSGEYSETLEFGEVATWTSVLAQLLPTCGLALAIALLWSSWSPLRRPAVRGTLAAALAAVCAVSAFSITRGWGPTAPLGKGDVSMSCMGEAPQVCMPEETASGLKAVHSDVVSALDDLAAAGITPTAPSLVTDTLADGRDHPASTKSTWRVGLTKGAERGTVRYQIVRSAIAFPCRRPDLATTRVVVGWAAERTGESKTLEKLLAQDPFYGTEQRSALQRQVRAVLGKPGPEQTRWYRQQLTAACAKSGNGGAA
ncbi:hypothetical protein [Streptomyces sp. Ru72]|uniref:DUF7224 domain-containing protein n=1 Tax=Streptomyces sp. Ru72 TaxID=2080747 RepID=UPI000CDDE0EF|nr:hypothetical protein [Streptomyces sp. Ru72]POX42042.1 hypothetical protein C3488_37180 [Streptomyces sp. Ru72]